MNTQVFLTILNLGKRTKRKALFLTMINKPVFTGTDVQMYRNIHFVAMNTHDEPTCKMYQQTEKRMCCNPKHLMSL